MQEFAESLDQLWSVQKHDREIVRAQDEIDKHERELKAEQAKLDKAEAALQARRDELRKLQSRHKEIEDELHRLDDRVKKLEAQGTEAGNEAAAKQRERIDALETEGLELIGEVGTAKLEVESAEAEYKMKGEVLAARQDSTAKLIEEQRKLIEVTQGSRDAASAKVVPELLQVYDEVNARHPGNALCHLEGEFCGGCQAELNTQLQMQIRARLEILRCRNCGRILDA